MTPPWLPTTRSTPSLAAPTSTSAAVAQSIRPARTTLSAAGATVDWTTGSTATCCSDRRVPLQRSEPKASPREVPHVPGSTQRQRPRDDDDGCDLETTDQGP